MPTSDIKGMYSRNWVKALLLHFYFLPLLHFYFLPLLHFISWQSCIFISWPLCTFISCPSCSLALLFLAPLALLFLFTLRNTFILAPLALFSAPCDNSAHDQGQSSLENAKKIFGMAIAIPGILCLHLLHHLLAEAADLGRALDHHVLRALVPMYVCSVKKVSEKN